MAGQRSASADPRRVDTRGWRWRTNSFTPALAWVCVGVAAAFAGEFGARAWRSLADQSWSALAARRPGAALSHGAEGFWAAVSLAAVAAFVLAACALLHALATRQVGGAGPPSIEARRRITAAPWQRVCLALLGASSFAVAHTGVFAGAARGVAASEQGLRDLYVGWATALPWALAVVLTTVGALEGWVAWRRLAVARAREERA